MRLRSLRTVFACLVAAFLVERGLAAESTVAASMTNVSAAVGRLPDSPPANTSPWLKELAKIIQAGVDESVITAFIANTEGTFNAGPDQVLWLSRIGLPGHLVPVIFEHDLEFIQGHRELKGSTIPGGPPATDTRSLSARLASLKSPAATREPDPNPDTIIVYEDNQSDAGAFPGPTGEGAEVRHCLPKLYRVRKPHPVPLTDTIVVFRSEPRIPNLVVINPLPQ